MLRLFRLFGVKTYFCADWDLRTILLRTELGGPTPTTQWPSMDRWLKRCVKSLSPVASTKQRSSGMRALVAMTSTTIAMSAELLPEMGYATCTLVNPLRARSNSVLLESCFRLPYVLRTTGFPNCGAAAMKVKVKVKMRVKVKVKVKVKVAIKIS